MESNREIIGYLLAAILLIFAAFAFKNKKYWLAFFWSILAFGSAFISQSESFKVSKEGFDFQRKSIESTLIEEQSKVSSVLFLSQEYPASQGYTYRQSIDLRSKPVVMTFQADEQPLWLAIGNVGNINASNPTLYLDFGGKVKVRADKNKSRPWLEGDPNHTYSAKYNAQIQPGSGIRLNPLFVRFEKDNTYTVSYTITTDNENHLSGTFEIKVVK